MNSQNISIENRLNSIIYNKFEISNISTNIQLRNENLLGDILNFTPSYLLILFFEIEKEFNISIPEEEIVDGNFNSFINIVKIIQKQI